MKIKKVKEFKFDINAKKRIVTDNEIITSLEEFAKIKNFKYFSTKEYTAWDKRVVWADTISDRFGSWRKALKIIGIEGAREREYSTEDLIANLENVWKEMGYPPGRRQLSKRGNKISERPYKRIWGSVQNACRQISLYHEGKITLEQLLNVKIVNGLNRKTIPLQVRWRVLKRDNYTCVKCGKSPAKNHDAELEIDHIIPVSKHGTNDIENLQTLCWSCNQGKKNKD